MINSEGSDSRVKAVLVYLVLGIVLRAVLALTGAGVEPWTDMAVYRDLADKIQRGESISNAGRAVGYPFFVASLMSIGGSVLWVYAIQAVLSLMSVFVLGLMAKAWLGHVAFAPTVALGATSLAMAQYSGLLLTESLFLFMFLLWILLLFSHGRYWLPATAISGVLAGCAIVVKPASIPLAIGSCLGCMAHRWHALPRMVLFTGVGILVAVGAMNALSARTGAMAYLTPTLGTNLMVGSPRGAPLHGGGGSAAVPHGGEDSDKYTAQSALRQASEAPGRVLGLGLVRIVRLVSMNPGRVETDFLIKVGLPEVLAIAWLGVEWALLCALFLVGLKSETLSKRMPRALGLIALPYILVLCVTFVQTRFRLPLHALMLPLGGLGLHRLLVSVGTPQLTSVSRGAILGAAGVLLATSVDVVLHMLART